jgi:cyclic pyranopterin phosphate synthase
LLRDNHNRPVNYLRLAVTDRCNLRCFYCMPEEGIEYVPRAELMSYEEMLRIVRLLVGMGIQKLRITGGEPFIRRDIMDFLRETSRLEGLRQIHVTTNGVTTAPLVPELQRLGIRSVNLSHDTLDRQRFHHITRRDDLPKVLETLDALLHHRIETKINAVLMAGKNDGDLLPLSMLTSELPVGVRFIEEMPFNGSGGTTADLGWWSHQRILAALRQHFPGLEKLPDPPHSTSMNYRIPGHAGTVGIIAAYSRTFCGTCNRIRLTPQGLLKTCLYDDGVFNIKELLRAGATDADLRTAVLEALADRARDGHEAEARRRFGLPVSESMATIGG